MSTVVVAVTDLDRARAFWSQALGYRPSDNGPASAAMLLVDPAGRGPAIALRVADRPAGLTPMHLDLYADQPGKHVDRLVGLGATLVEPAHQDERGTISLRDPDGNEFCVVPHDPAGR